MTELTDEQRRVVERVEKMLRLAARNSNENESAAAAAKAQELLARYNLDVAQVEQASGQSGAREDMKQKGGMYQYQRQLWQAVAKLNFCLYFSIKVRNTRKNGRSFWETQHRCVGRTVNTRLTIAMASHLDQTIERLTRERLHEKGEGHKQFFSTWAVAYREGIAARVIEKLGDRREHLLKEEQKKERAAEKAARAAGRAGVSTATTITLRSLDQSEDDANQDFLHGEGYSARKRERERLRREEDAADAAREEVEWAQWCKDHPEELAELERKAEAERRANDKYQERYKARTGHYPGEGRYYGRSTSASERHSESGAFYAGYDAGDKVSLDQQVDTRNQRRIGRG